MPFTPRIKPSATTRATAPTVQVLVHRQYILALTAQNCSLITLGDWPDSGFVRFELVVAGDAGVEFRAAGVLDCDDVQGGVPVCALC
jgi:hypothetical protein